MDIGSRVNVINRQNGRSVLRNATVIGSVADGSLTVVSHRTERFPVAVPTASCEAYVPRTRNATLPLVVPINGATAFPNAVMLTR